MLKKLHRLNESKTELTDALYLILLQGLNQLLPLLVMPYLMVVLGAGRYGYIGFSLSVVQYFALVVDFGFNLSATKKVALVKDRPEELNRVFWAIVWSKTLLMGATLAAMCVLIAAVPTFRNYGWAILCTYPMVVGTAYTFQWMYQGIGKVRLMAVINTCSKLLLLPLIFILVKSPDDYLLAALLQALVFVLTAAASSAALFRMHVVGRPVWRPADMKRETRDSFPLFLSSASTSVYTQLFVVILGFFCQPEAVGRYASAERIMRAACFVLYLPVNQAFFPKVSALSKSDRGSAVRMFKQVRFLVFTAMSIVALSLFVMAPYASWLLGSGYEGIGTLLRVMAFAPLPIGLGAVYGQIGLIALGDRRARGHFRNVYFAVAACALAFVLAGTFVARENGAAVALLLSETLVFALMFHYAKKDLNLC